ncbi:MAG: crossover junction endodeoxyribonuclease RuvC, partial [Candidatus Omnitrophica bacterium]|nr:crossover junction endodeoxyribonuclease RuvC [Candidatus Omnitrophota bacterium]
DVRGRGFREFLRAVLISGRVRRATVPYLVQATVVLLGLGVACLVAQEHGVPLAEYPPTQVKKSLTGNGSASKEQVARMVGQWLRQTEEAWSADTTDALALAIVHAHIEAQRRNLPEGVGT